MRKIISMMMIAAMALFAVACDETNKDDKEYDLSGDKYTGELTILGSTQKDIVIYADTNDDNGTVDIMMPEVSFMPGLMPSLDMALIDIESTDPGYFVASTSQMVGIYDRLPLINDVIKSISNVSVVMSDQKITVSFICSITTEAMGDMNVPVSYIGYKDGQTPNPEFSMDNKEGFFITTSSGEVLLTKAAVTYYEGNKAIVIDGFSYSASAYMKPTTLPIIGVSDKDSFDKRTISGDDITVNYTFMEMPTTGTVNDLTCEIIDGKAQMSFSISAAMGGSGAANSYPCKFNGAITINTGSYTAK